MEIVPGIHWLKGINGNVYLIVNDDELTLIDTGMPHKAQVILKYITETLNKQPEDLKTIILTHGDIDHIGNLTDLKQISGAIVAAHSIETDYIAGRTFKPIAHNTVLFKLMRFAMKKIMNFPHTEVEQKLEDNDVIAGLTVIFTPGHSAGSICLYDPVRKALFSGDTLLSSKGKITGPRSAVTPDMDTAWASVEKLKELDIEVVLPGHGEPIKNDATNQVRALKQAEK